MVWYSEFNAIFFITITTIMIGSFGLILKFCLKSKCENFDCCWGLVNVKRNVDIEAQQEKYAIDHGINPYDEEKNNN